MKPHKLSTRKYRTKHVVLLTSVLLAVNGCAIGTPETTPRDPLCRYLKPIYYSEKHDSDATIEQILDYLEIYEAACATLSG